MQIEKCCLCNEQQDTPARLMSLKRSFFRCENCDLIQVSADAFLGFDDQHEHYKLHENSLNQIGYVNFLKKFISSFDPYIDLSGKILDYGSGPQPCLAELLSSLCFEVQTYDPIYSPVKPEGLHDTVVACEVVEHFNRPKVDWQSMRECLRPGGVLAIRTESLGDRDFSNWHYPRDPTHVVFYSDKTFFWIAENFGLEIISLDSPFFVFRAV